MTWHTEFIANSYNAAIDKIDAIDAPVAAKEAVIEAINAINVPDGYLMHVKFSGNVSSYGSNITTEVRYVCAALKPADPVTEDTGPASDVPAPVSG